LVWDLPLNLNGCEENVIGLMREALRAGMYPAIKATPLNSRIMPANVAGSGGSGLFVVLF
jgi:hypothetical protein